MNLVPEKIIPYFQPIFSADSKNVYSYEILGRYIDDDGKIQSLGPFFNDDNTTNEDALRIDRLIRREAMRKYAEDKREEYLFINIRLAWLMQFANNPEEMLTLQWAKEFGIPANKLVIEITEEEFYANDTYIRTIVHYKNIGCRIALDDYGKKASDIERLAKLKPDIIKINMEYIHNSENSYHYREYMRSIANFAESVGIEVLYEGVETQKQLDICMSLKGRYYQGFLLAMPQPSMGNTVVNEAIFSTSIDNLYETLWNEIKKTDSLRKSLDTQIENFLAKNPFDSTEKNHDSYLTKLCIGLSNTRMIFLCDKKGNQITSNIEHESVNPASGGEQLALYKNKNWVWRGYFYETLKSIAAGQKSCISSAYRDFTSKENVRTYSYAISEEIILFVDIGTA